MQLPEYVYEVLQKLNNNGYEAYCVGGCVRDYLLGQCPEDYDVTTSALPEQIIEVFDGYRLLMVGLKHGTVTVIINKHPVEITELTANISITAILQKSDLLRILPMTLQEGISRLMP